MDAQLKVSRSITKLGYDKPFFGSCAMTLRVYENNSTPTMATDGFSIMWNREFVDKLSEDECEAIIAHEVLHVVWLHHLRQGDRNPKKCNISMDYAINWTLKEEGFKFPEGVLLDAQYKDMNWEKIYNLLPENLIECPWGEVIQAVDDNGNPLTGAALEEAKLKVQQMATRAAEQHKQQGCGSLPGGIEDLIKSIRKTKIDWKAYIRSYLITKNPAECTWRNPNRRMMGGYGIYMPSMQDTSCGPIAIGLDTSGSVSDKELEAYLGELQAINEELRPEKMYVLCCDADIAECYEFTPHDDISELKIKGRGGTMVTPVFKYIEECLPEVETILYFTDMGIFWGQESTTEPRQPVIWFATDSGFEEPPFGTVIEVNV